MTQYIVFDQNGDEIDADVTFDTAVETMCDHVAHCLTLTFDNDDDDVITTRATFTFFYHHQTGRVDCVQDGYTVCCAIVMPDKHERDLDLALSFTDLCDTYTNTGATCTQ